MRNFHHTFNDSCVFTIDFSLEIESLQVILGGCLQKLNEAFDNVGPFNKDTLTPSEESVIDDFLEWFHVFVSKRSNSIVSSSMPPNTCFTYVNCNSGVGLLFIGQFDFGYGDVIFPGLNRLG